MFQTFEVTSRPEQGPPRLVALRTALSGAGLDGFIIPRADAHQGEYVAPHDERLAWLTGFTGSAGFCAVLPDIAGVFVDGRYRTQVKAQVDLARFTPVDWPETKLSDWLKTHLPAGGRVGFDPWLHTRDEVDTLRAALAGSRVSVHETANLVDAIWPDQPPPPTGPITDYPVERAGQHSGEKRAGIAAALVAAGQNAVVLTLPDSIAWLLNIRGADIPRNPVPLAFAILHDDGKVQLFTEPAKRAGLPPDPDIDIRPTEAFAGALAALTGTVRADPKTAAHAVFQALEDAGITVAPADDPCLLPKARKNPVEIAGTVEAHLRDAAAMCEFLCWLDAEAPKGGLTEIDVVTALEGFRRATNALREISFDTICGAGPNGAIVHYRVSEDTNRPITPGEILLIDSGGQYLDGTTDITRTVAVGPVPEAVRAPFTRVLQGMIAVSRLRWPKGRAGRDLEAVARYPLWLAGQDYDHGTGHGVGVYLCVHEGPQRLSRISDVPLEPGMILSNEPGYYREGAFGIRIENLIVVEAASPLPGADAGREMLSFRTLTFVPIDRRLIDGALLTGPERDWLNAYHAEVVEKVGPRLSLAARRWLMDAAAPI